MAAITDAPRDELGGDPDAVIRELYSHYAKALHGYVEQFCPDRASADDIVQETFIRAWRHLPQLSADDRPIRPWLFRVARNLLTDANRAARARPMTAQEQSAGEVGTDSGLEEILDRQLVSAALAHLSPAHQTVLVVHTIRDDRAAIEGQTGAHILVGGTTASNIDVSAKLSSALPIFLVVVVGLAFILLTFAFRTILVPIKSILGFLLSMAAALGAQVAMFQWGWGEHIFGITPAATISFLPIIMLAIIFGLSSDYEVFVVSRIKEEYTRNGDARRAVQRGTGLSARVVTAAALIMFSIFVAFMFTNDPTIKAIGFSFAVGVFLDAFVVRLTLVPATMAIIGSRLWYHPQWFARYVPDPDIEGHRLEHKLTEKELAAAGTSARGNVG